MSRELLKRCKDFMDCIDLPRPEKLYTALEAELSKPDPEPVAWVTIDRSEHKRCQMVRLSQAVLDEYDLKQYPLYAEPVDQSAWIADLTERLAKATLDYAESSNLLTERITELEQQLAALQAKREPLTDEEVVHLAIKMKSTFNAHPFARAIEAAHGIGEII